jgi:transposase
MPFPIQRFQTGPRGGVFRYQVQEYLHEQGIKFRPNRPAAPHLNGKVERSQKTVKLEFYPTVNLNDPDLDRLLGEWQHYYKLGTHHSSLGGKTPMDKYFELMWQNTLPVSCLGTI